MPQYVRLYLFGISERHTARLTDHLGFTWQRVFVYLLLYKTSRSQTNIATSHKLVNSNLENYEGLSGIEVWLENQILVGIKDTYEYFLFILEIDEIY